MNDPAVRTPSLRRAPARTLPLRRLPLLVPAFLLVLAGCVEMTDPIPVILWEGTLNPVPGALLEVNGDIAMVANQQSTQMGVGVRTQTPDQALTWEVREGSCADPGPGLIEAGLYPVLETDEVGEADADIQIGRRINTTRAYHLRVGWFDGVETNLGSGSEVLSCGNFQRTTLN